MIDPDGMLGTAIDVVTSRISDIDALAVAYNAQLSESLDKIASVEVDAVSAPTRPLPPTIAAPSLSLGDYPIYDNATLQLPMPPQGLEDIDSLLSSLDVGELGNIPDPPTSPLIIIPDAPGFLQIDPPVRPDIDMTVDIPQEPILSMPDMGELKEIVLPVFEFPQLPDFNETPPTASDITVPNVFVNWTEPVYSPEILDELKGKISELLSGGTGIPAAVEDALFFRARDRLSAESQKAMQEAFDTWAARGYSMPPGMLVNQLDIIREQESLKASELNREILVQSATWEIENLRFAVTQGLALEQLTQNLHENMAKRLFEVARFHAESQMSVFNAQIGLFNAKNSAFQTLAQVYRTKIDAAISKISAYKAAVDGQVAISQINQQTVEVFKAKLEAVLSHVDIYKSMVQGASIKADAIKSRFDAYRADVQAYSEQVGAEKVKFDAYQARVQGESAKANILDSQARAYASTIQAIANKSDIRVKNAQLKLDGARVKISKFLADVDAYKALLQANLGHVQFSVSAYQAQIDAWRSRASVLTAEAEMQSRFTDTATRTAIAYAEMQIKEYEAKSSKAVQDAQVLLEASKALGQYTAQLAAGALSAAHVSASISGSGSSSSSSTRSEGTSTSHNYNY